MVDFDFEIVRRVLAVPKALRLPIGLSLLFLAGCWSRSEKSAPDQLPGSAQVPEEAIAPPPLTTSTYLNTVAGVRYVGDARCAACHDEIARTYAAHPMGRSMHEVVASDRDEFERDGPNAFAADGLQYTVAWDGERMMHIEQQFDATGGLLYEKSAAVDYVVGAGSHGRSYLIQRGNSLWMSPMTWYPQRQGWALSPNYDLQNHHFIRPILPDCLFCHSNRANHRLHTVNLYESPVFSGLSIGCERCHGPGDLHVKKHAQGDLAGGSRDETIVNPRDLPPELRDGVCQQCHLGGSIRVVRRGRDAYGYRPGLPWDEYMSTFVKRPSAGDLATVTSHEEQMRSSRCYQASLPNLGCISCHDPHQKPDASDTTSYFRRRCHACHNDADCAELQRRRESTMPPDNCLACHMPAVASEVKHAAITDHRILRRLTAKPRPTADRSGEGFALAFFDGGQIEPQDPEARRDLAIAMMEFGGEHPDLLGPDDLPTLLEILTMAVERDPQDFAAVEGLAHAQFSMNRPIEALGAIEAALEHAPGHERLLAGAVLIASRSQQWEAAHRYIQRLVVLNPHQVRYRQIAAQVALVKRDLDRAVAECEAGLQLNPADQDSRRALVQMLHRQHRLEEAERQADLLRRLSTVAKKRDAGGRRTEDITQP